MPRSTSQKRAASDAFDTVRRKVRRMLKDTNHLLIRIPLKELEAWLAQRIPRAKAKKGGL